VNQLDLYCSSSFEIGLYGSMFFFGYLISCVVFPPLADVYGRKKFVIGVCLVHGLCFLSMIFFPNIVSFYTSIFIFGAMGPLKNMIAYTHLMEFLPAKVSETSGILFFIDDFLQVICPLVLMYLTRNTNTFLWAGVIQNAFALLAFAYMYIPESTKFLLEKHRFEEV
jgi:MFS family permease